ncbi:uncharacterized protein UHOD_11301 [Ustilago sp. UG-2017b]|nr:uncharacterized protein UHOD_11301 [Ustilago sp. UG-2017b]
MLLPGCTIQLGLKSGIVESVVGQPGSIQDSKVWASGSNILKKPRLYLDKVRVEHAIAYLKNRFQCLTGYCSNIYRVKDCITAAETIQACIVAHTFDEVSEVVQSLQLGASDTQELRRTRCTNQQEYKLDLATATQGMSQYAVSRLQSSAAHDLREEMFQVLFISTGHNEEDTTALS